MERTPIRDTPADLKARLEAERRGTPFVFLHDGDGSQRIFSLDGDQERLTIGRDAAADLCLDWDENVSSLHAWLERTGAFWTVHDDGLSRNGSFLNGERVQGDRVLRDGDELRFGTTTVVFRDVGARRAQTAAMKRLEQAGPEISPAQKRVLIALCRPYKGRPAFARPATNQQIAEELVLSIEAVKSHLKALFAKFDLDGVPQNEKRVRLVERAFEQGALYDHEL